MSSFCATNLKMPSTDDHPAKEHSICSFWLVDNDRSQGRYEEAQRLFDRLLSRCNDVGLSARN